LGNSRRGIMWVRVGGLKALRLRDVELGVILLGRLDMEGDEGWVMVRLTTDNIIVRMRGHD
jgi:hypothetical protein